MNNLVGWFEIYAQDMARAKTFYEAVLAVELSRLENQDFLESPDLDIWAFPMQPEKPGASGTLVKMPGLPPAATARWFISTV